MRIICLTFLSVLFLQNAFAQHDVFFVGGADYGLPFNSYTQTRNVLRARIPSSQINLNMSLQYRIFDIVGFEVGAGQSYRYLRLRDKTFENTNDGFDTGIKSKNFYFTTFAALQFYIPVTEGKYVYLSGGYALNLTGSDQLSDSDVFVKGKQTLSINNNYSGQNNSIIAEIGYQQHLSNKSTFYAGLKVNVGRSAFMKADYTLSDNTTGENVYSDQMQDYGTYAGVTLKYGFHALHINKKEKAPKPPKEPKPEKPPVVKNPKPDKPVVTEPKDSAAPEKVEGRQVAIEHKVKVNNPTVTIKVWDHQVVDGDVISLNLNGEWILQNYTLEKQQKVITLELKPGKNYLILHAHNLGRYSPNTAAIIVDDGNKQNQVILESTLDSSGTIEITVGE